jgi:hypothetical protein
MLNKSDFLPQLHIRIVVQIDEGIVREKIQEARIKSDRNRAS